MNDKQQLAAMGAHMAEQPMCLARWVEELQAKCGAQAELLREIAKWILNGDAGDFGAVIRRIDALLAGQMQARHPDDAAVERFAVAMKAKLAAAREKGRGGWGNPAECSEEFLADLLVGHIGKGNPGNFEDIANLAMMLHQRGADPAVLASATNVVPESWQLVPVNPTGEMLRAYLKDGCAILAMPGYRAMLAAAPKPDSTK